MGDKHIESLSKCARYYWRDPERARMQAAVSYYRDRRAKGHNEPPKLSSKLTKYCEKHGLNVVAVIDGTQNLPGVDCGVDPALVKLQSLAEYYKQIYETYQKQPWVPEENSSLRLWCDQHNVDVMDIVVGKISLLQIANTQ